MNDFAIDKNVPAPAGSGRRGAPAKYPFSEMEFGDSFEVDSTKSQSVRTSAAQFGRRTGRKFSVKQAGPGKHRCWRVE